MEILTFEGDRADLLIEMLTRYTAGKDIYRMRVAFDGDTFKIKVNEGMWSPAIYPTRKGS